MGDPMKQPGVEKAEWGGFEEVTKEAFWAYIGPRDIISASKGDSKHKLGIYSRFAMRHGTVVGYIQGGAYWLSLSKPK